MSLLLPKAETSTPALSWRSGAAALLIVLAGALTLALHRQLPLVREYRDHDLPLLAHWDSMCYYRMAIGEHAAVPSPFSKRALYPWLAGTLATTAHINVNTAFVIWNLLAFALLAWCISAALEITIGKPWLAVLLLLTPMPLESLELAYLPDLFHTALTAFFFLLLLKEKLWPALIVLFVSFATRESTLLMCLSTAALAFRRRHRILLVSSLAILVLGTLISNAFAKLGAPNLHHMPDFLYLVLKVPFNFCLNFLGLTIWTDVNNMGQPFVKWHVPAFLHRLVTDREIGLDWDWRLPVKTLILYLTVFGTAPLLLARFRKPWRALLEAPLAIQLAFFYGVLCYLIGPTLGNWVERLIAYGWPAFWIALPWLIYKYLAPLKTWEAVLLAVNFLSLAWWPSLFGWSPTTNYPVCALGVLVLCAPTLVLMRRITTLAPAAEVPQPNAAGAASH
jgi:hypothetical protein